VDEILASTAGADRILVVGCDSCVAECAAGGRKETALTASALSIALQGQNRDAEVRQAVLDRQCVNEFLPQIAAEVEWADVVVSLGCGAGVQSLARFYPQLDVIPGLDTEFIGSTVEPGVWVEDCSGCGRCQLAHFGAICPLTRCAKRLLNGPCGGSVDGRCEIDPDQECAWQLIYDRLEALGRLDRLLDFVPPHDWGAPRSTRPRRVVREDRRV
jgi:ferredoxin